MKKAFAIGCWLPTPWHEKQLLACVLSIRSVGHIEDILLLTVDPEFESRIKPRVAGLGCQVHTFPEIQSNITINMKRKLPRADTQKFYFWAISEKYDKVIGIDTDVMFHHNADKLFDFSAVTGFKAKHEIIANKLVPPVSFGHFVYKPDRKIFNDLKAIIEDGFSIYEGWGHHGLYEWENKKHLWDFFCANASQGYLYYYFFILNEAHWEHNEVFYSVLDHYCGKRNRTDTEDYITDMLTLIRYA